MSVNKIKRGNNVMVRNMKICKYFLAVFAVILTFQSVVLLINFCTFLWTSPEQIFVTQTEGAVKIQAFIGYFQLSSQYLPINDNLEVSAKVFGASIAAITLFFEKIPSFLVLWKVAQILQKMTSSPFSDEICQKIKEVGWIIVYFGLLQKLLFQSGISLICYHKFWINNPINLTLLFAGAVILLIGDIFVYGCELQKENEEVL